MASELIKFDFESLGTDIEITVVSMKGVVSRENLKKRIREFFQKKEKIFNRFDVQSELSQLNDKLGSFNSASCDIIELGKKSLLYYSETEKYFDPRILDFLCQIGYDRKFSEAKFSFPRVEKLRFKKELFKKTLGKELKISGGMIFFGCPMDFSGIAKGWIVDEAAKYLKNLGFSDILVDAGGDIRILGKDLAGEDWRVSLEGFSQEKILIELDDVFQGIATSGITRRKWEVSGKRVHHLVNPKNPGKFDFSLRSVTVVARNTEVADVWAKTLFLMGQEKGREFSSQKNIKSIFLDCRGNAWLSQAMKSSLA